MTKMMQTVKKAKLIKDLHGDKEANDCDVTQKARGQTISSEWKSPISDFWTKELINQ